MKLVTIFLFCLFLPFQSSALDIDKKISLRCKTRWAKKPSQIGYCEFLQRDSFSYVTDWMNLHDLFNDNTKNVAEKKIAEHCFSFWKDDKEGPDWAIVHACIYIEESLLEEKNNRKKKTKEKQKNKSKVKGLTMLSRVVDRKCNQRRNTCSTKTQSQKKI